MTLTAEMSRLTLSFGNSRSKRQTEIGQIKAALRLQIKDGRASAKQMSASLFEVIERDLKIISRSVAANRKSASDLIKAVNAGRHADAKLLRTKLQADRMRLRVQVKNIIDGLERDRLAAGRIIRSSAVAHKTKVASSVTPKVAASFVAAKDDSAKMPVSATLEQAVVSAVKADVPATPAANTSSSAYSLANPMKADQSMAAKKPTEKSAVSLAPSFGAPKATATPPITSAAKPGGTKK